MEFMSAWPPSGTFNMHACVESPASILSEQWTCADGMHNVINKTYFRFGTTFPGQHFFKDFPSFTIVLHFCAFY